MGFTPGNYLLLVEYAGRLFPRGRASISREVASVFARLESDAVWQDRLLKLSDGRRLGRFLAASREPLRAVAE